MDKLEAGEKLCVAAGIVSQLYQVTGEVPLHIQSLNIAIQDYAQSPAIPPLERILEALETAINAKYDFISEKQKSIHLVIAELRKAVGE